MSANLTLVQHVEVDNSNRSLTEREETFLTVLFKDAKGDFRVAKDLAGYPAKTPLSAVVKRLKKEIIEEAQTYLATNMPAAIAVIVDIITSPEPVSDARNRLAAAKELLDRVGLVKTEQKVVNHTGGVALLPPKDSR